MLHVCKLSGIMSNQLMYSSLGRSNSSAHRVTLFSVIFCRELKSHGLLSSLMCSLLSSLFSLHLVNSTSDTLHLYLLILLGDKKKSHSNTLFSYGSYNIFTLFPMFHESWELECCVEVYPLDLTSTTQPAVSLPQ